MLYITRRPDKHFISTELCCLRINLPRRLCSSYLMNLLFHAMYFLHNWKKMSHFVETGIDVLSAVAENLNRYKICIEWFIVNHSKYLCKLVSVWLWSFFLVGSKLVLVNWLVFSGRWKKMKPLKYGFWKKSLLYKCTSDQLNSFFLNLGYLTVYSIP